MRHVLYLFPIFLTFQALLTFFPTFQISYCCLQEFFRTDFWFPIFVLLTVFCLLIFALLTAFCLLIFVLLDFFRTVFWFPIFVLLNVFCLLIFALLDFFRTVFWFLLLSTLKFEFSILNFSYFIGLILIF